MKIFVLGVKNVEANIVNLRSMFQRFQTHRYRTVAAVRSNFDDSPGLHQGDEGLKLRISRRSSFKKNRTWGALDDLVRFHSLIGN